MYEELHSVYYSGKQDNRHILVTRWNDSENCTYDENDDLIKAYCVDNTYIKEVYDEFFAEHGGSGETFMSLTEAKNCVIERLS